MEKLFTTRFGSFLYGTNTPTSDIDIKHVVLPSLNDLLVGKAVKNTVKKTNIVAFTKNSVDDVDEEFIPVQVFAHDFLGGQTYALELAFAIDGTEAMQEIYNQEFVRFCKELRTTFLTSNVRAMIGYAVNQANLYSAKGERLNALRATETLFKSIIKTVGRDVKISEHADYFEEYAAEVCKQFPKYVTLEEYSINPEGDLRPCIKVLEKVIPYSNTFENGLSVIKAALKRYGSRAKTASIDNVGWKSCAHSSRIIWEGIQLLSNKTLTFPLPAQEVEYFLAIKHGELPAKEVFSKLNSDLEQLKHLEKVSTLRKNLPEIKEELNIWLADWMRRFYKI